MTPRALLISLRDPNDAMAEQERRCFADRAALPLDAIDRWAVAEGLPDDATLRRYDAVFFGGSGAYSVLDDVPWIRDGITLCLRVRDLRVPAWASCFGFQGLALVMGGEVVRDDTRQELGATELDLTDAGVADPLFGTLPRRFWAQEGHHDHVTVLPPGVTLMATGAVSLHQGFKIDGAPFWASQFHPELTPETTTERFDYYLSHYGGSDPEQDAKNRHWLMTGQDSPEVAQLLARLVRGAF